MNSTVKESGKNNRFPKKMSTFVPIYNLLSIMDKEINRIKVVLVEKKRTNKWLAEQLGCAPTTVSKWCTNACQPPMETYLRIAKLLEVEIGQLLNQKYFESV